MTEVFTLLGAGLAAVGRAVSLAASGDRESAYIALGEALSALSSARSSIAEQRVADEAEQERARR